MEFDIFEKLSDLETKIHFLKLEIVEKDELINQLRRHNLSLEKQLGNSCGINASTKVLCDKETSTSVEPESTIRNTFEQEPNKSVAEILKETSETVMQTTGYVFDTETGLYFDQVSGYYYDPDNQLFFEPRTGVYYSYDSETREYSYHSRVSSELSGKFRELLSKGALISPESTQNKSDVRERHQRCSTDRQSLRRGETTKSSRHHRWRSHRRSRSRSFSSSCSSDHRRSRRRRRPSHSDSESNSPHHSRSRKRSGSYKFHRFSSHHQHQPARNLHKSPSPEAENKTPMTTCVAASAVLYPPSVRLMVLSSDCLPIGTVGIVTSKEAISGWGCLGRNFGYCPALNLMNDEELEEIHCELSFHSEEETYHLKDRKSKSGTFLNGLKLQDYERKPLYHGDVLRIGSNRLLVHIHAGTETCGQCEPQSVHVALQNIAPTPCDTATEGVADGREVSIAKSTPGIVGPALNALSKETLRRTKLGELKSKYGLKGAGLREERLKHVKVGDGDYFDRAAQRRAIENKRSKRGNAKAYAPTDGSVNRTQASVHTPIDDKNVGAKMLAKMGWNRGEGLGKERRGIAEPVSIGIRVNPHAGLGSSTSASGINGSSMDASLVSMDATPAELRQARVLAATRERYRRIEENALMTAAGNRI